MSRSGRAAHLSFICRAELQPTVVWGSAGFEYKAFVYFASQPWTWASAIYAHWKTWRFQRKNPFLRALWGRPGGLAMDKPQNQELLALRQERPPVGTALGSPVSPGERPCPAGCRVRGCRSLGCLPGTHLVEFFSKQKYRQGHGVNQPSVGGTEEENKEGPQVPASHVLLSRECVSCARNLPAKPSAPINTPVVCSPLHDAASLCALSLWGQRY